MNVHVPWNRAWADWFIVREMGDELLVYDLRTQKVSSLTGLAAKVWQVWHENLDTRAIEAALADRGVRIRYQEEIELTLDDLRKAGLLPGKPRRRGRDRRDFLGRFFTSGAAATVSRLAPAATPAVVTILAPKPAEAASGCTTDSQCSLGSYCNASSKTCVQGCTSNARCPAGSTPYCASSMECVQCIANSECSGATPVCRSYTCVPCTLSADCGNGQFCQNGTCLSGCASDSSCNYPKPKCNTADHTCVQCLSNNDCSGGSPICVNHQCVPCTSNSQCNTGATCENGECNDAGRCLDNSECFGVTPFCEQTSHHCVQCLNSENCEDPFYPVCSNGECSDH